MPLYARRQSKPPPGTGIDWSHPLAHGLASLWALSEGSGLPIDSAAQAAAAANSAAWSAGQYGTSLSFNGSSQYVNLGAQPQLELVAPFSVVSCCAPTASTSNQHLIDVRSGGANGYFLAFDLNGNNEIDLFVQNGVGDATSPSSNNAVDGATHVFAATLTTAASNNVAFYRDGTAWGTATNPNFTTSYSSTPNIFVGQNSVNGAWFKGQIDWIAVWNRALAAAEILALADPNAIWRLFAPPRPYALYRRAPGASAYGRGSSALRPHMLPRAHAWEN
jgi:Concanavalin A-like lectin/glucanases superfamily